MGFTSKSLQFGGTDEYVTMGDVLGFERTDPFTLSCWVKYVSQGILIGKLLGGPTNQGYQFYLYSSGSLYFALNNDVSTSAYLEATSLVSAASDGLWHHVAVSYRGDSDANNVQFYVDGSPIGKTIGTNSLSATSLSSAPLCLGGHSLLPGVANFLSGRLDEVAIYGRELTPTEISWVYNGFNPRDLYASGAPSGLLAWWRCGDGDVPSTLVLLDSGPGAVHPAVNDLGGSNLSGTMTNMAGTDIVADNPGGTFAKRCIQFNSASSQYITFGNVLAYERTQPFSISFWFKTSDVSGPYLIAKMGATPTFRGYGVALSATGELIFVLRNDNTTTNRIIVNTIATGFNDGNWHHVTWVYAGTSLASGCTCFVDSVLRPLNVVTNTLSATIVDTSALFLGGASYGGTPGSHFTGKFDEVTAYNRVLTATEVAWIYNSGVPHDLKRPEAPTWLTAYWRLGENAYPGALTNMEVTDFTNDTVYSNAAPILDYTWRFKNNVDLNTTGTRLGDFRQLLLAMKDALKTASGWTDSTGTAATLTTPWTVVASSDGTTANTSDNWTTATSLVFAASGSAHSWIVLRQTGINGQNAEVCIDLNSTSDYQMSLVMSFAAGFDVSSPSVSNRPTAPDQEVRYSSVNWLGGITTTFSCILDVAVSDGGECTRLFVYVGGSVKNFWAFDKPKNPVSGWSNPVVFTVTGNPPSYSLLSDGVYGLFRGNSRNGYAYWATEFYVDGAIGERQTTVSDVTSEWPITRIGLISTYPALQGRHGDLSDVWFGDVTLVDGDTYPAVAPLKQFIQVGDIVLPWDRSVPVLT